MYQSSRLVLAIQSFKQTQRVCLIISISDISRNDTSRPPGYNVLYSDLAGAISFDNIFAISILADVNEVSKAVQQQIHANSQLNRKKWRV